MLRKILDLGYHPLADSFLKSNQIKSEIKKKLTCYINTKTKKIFLKSKFSPNYRYNHIDYSYTSSNSKESVRHWNDFYNSIYIKYKINNKKVLEIGSNDGYLLSLFKKNNKVLGLDSSKKMIQIANKNKVKSIQSIFSFKQSKKINKKFGKFELIIANHVLNHADNDLDFLKGCKNLLSENGIFVFEVPYWSFQVKNLIFDQIYHEHRNYYTATYIRNLEKLLKMKIVDVELNNYHGKSIRVFLALEKLKIIRSKKIFKLISKEEKNKIFNMLTYKKFSQKIYSFKKKYLIKLSKISKKNKIFAVGASAKGNTFLNFLELNKTLLSGVTDSSKFKIGKFTPGSHLKIYSDEIFKDLENIYVIILSWNIASMLKKKLSKINNKIKYI